MEKLIAIIFLALLVYINSPSSKRENSRSPASLGPQSESSYEARFQKRQSAVLKSPFRVNDELTRKRRRLAQLTQLQKATQLKLKTCTYGCDAYKILLSGVQAEKEDLSTTVDELAKYKVEDGLIREETWKRHMGQITDCENEAFRPDPFDPPKIINLNFHFPVLDKALSPSMFTEEHDGLGKISYTGFDHAQMLTAKTNSLLKSNAYGSGRLPIGFKVKKNLVEFPRVETGSDLSEYIPYYNFSKSVVNGEFLDDIELVKDGRVFNLSNDGINLVFQEQLGVSNWTPASFVLDSEGKRVLTKDRTEDLLTVFPHWNIRSGNAIDKKLPLDSAPLVVMANEWTGYAIKQRTWNPHQAEGRNDMQEQGFSLWDRSKLIAHAIGFTAGLGFVWEAENLLADGELRACDDHYVSPSSPWCGKAAGMNVMDNNCYMKSWSPCQLEIVHENLYHNLQKILYLPENSDRKYDHHIPAGLGQVLWDAPHHLVGDLYIGEGTELVLGCETTIARDAKVYPETRLKGGQNLRFR